MKYVTIVGIFLMSLLLTNSYAGSGWEHVYINIINMNAKTVYFGYEHYTPIGPQSTCISAYANAPGIWLKTNQSSALEVSYRLPASCAGSATYVLSLYFTPSPKPMGKITVIGAYSQLGSLTWTVTGSGKVSVNPGSDNTNFIATINP